MRITVFTSNQPRHIALIEALAAIADEVYVVQECTTVFPGRVADFYRRSDAMQAYFGRVIEAEREVFGRPRFAPREARLLPLRMGDLNLLEMDALGPALHSDVYLVFGAGYIQGPLCDHLIAHRAYNLHMGVSPYYRGSSTNFWAMYDNRPEYVGATIHLLTRGLDSGPILCHALPKAEATNPFVLGMKAVKAVHHAFVDLLRRGELDSLEPVSQDRSLAMRYTRNADFTDEIARAYLARLPSSSNVEAALRTRELSRFVHPYVF